MLTLAIPALLILPAFQLVNRIYDTFFLIGFPELTMTYMYLGTVMMMFFACIPFIISIFFYSRDLKFFATLPVKVDVIIFSKLASVYIYLFVIGCFFFGTSIVVYSTTDGLTVYRLIAGLIALLMAPLLPMILATLIIIPFMSVIGKGNKRNLMVIVGNVLLLVLIMSIQILMARVEMDPESLNRILLQEDGLLRLLGRNFPPSIWLTKMIQGSIIDGGLFILLNAVFLYILKLVSQLLYSKGLLAFNQEGGGMTGKGKIYYKTRSKGLQMMKRHIGIIFSNPIFLLNTVLVMFLPIILFIIMSFTGELSPEVFQSPAIAPYMLYIYAGVITAPAIVGNLSATAITREGKTFWETKVLPITTGENIRYRIYATLMISFTASILLAIAGGMYLPVTFDIIIRAAIFCIAATLFLSTIDIVINIERPTLNWTSPTAAVKNNLNVILSLLIRVALGGIVYFSYRLMPDFAANTMVAIYSIALLLLYGISNYIVFGIYKRKFDQINL